MSAMIVLYYQLLLQYVVLISYFSRREEEETQLLLDVAERTLRPERNAPRYWMSIQSVSSGY